MYPHFFFGLWLLVIDFEKDRFLAVPARHVRRIEVAAKERSPGRLAGEPRLDDAVVSFVPGGRLEWDESDEGGDEESWASRRRRARARRIALARRRQALIRARAQARGAALRRPAPVPAPPTSTRSTAAAIREVDLESKVAEDSLRRELGGMRRRMNRSEYAAVAGLAVNQFIESFNQPENEYARAALRFAPLLLLAPQRRGRGFESFVYDPRVMGGAAVLGITFLGQQRSRAAIVVRGKRGLPVAPCPVRGRAAGEGERGAGVPAKRRPRGGWAQSRDGPGFGSPFVAGTDRSGAVGCGRGACGRRDVRACRVGRW